MRGFLAPGYASARWFLENDHEIAYDWDEHRGRAGFAAALRTIDAAAADPSGRLSGVVSPMQIDTCSEELLRDVWRHAHGGRTRTLDSHACRLRAKLSSDTHRLVINVWGVGLRLIDG